MVPNYIIITGDIIDKACFLDEEFNKDIKVGIRVNFDLEKECPNETAMGLDGGRFGFSLENGSFNKAVKRINNIKNVKVVGIHLHNSTKTRSLKIYKTLAKKANEIADIGVFISWTKLST